MPKRVEIPFVGGQEQSREPALNNQLTVNMLPVPGGKNGKEWQALFSTPGLRLHTSLGHSDGRSNGVVFKDRGYGVIGDKLVQLDQNLNVTTVGTLLTTTGRVSMDAGFSYMMLVDGDFGYSYDGTTFAKITDPDFPAGANFVLWLDQYFIVNTATGDAISAQDNPTVWNALDRMVAEKMADKSQRPIWFRGDLLALGSMSAEFYNDTGNADFPFERYPSGTIERGTPAPHSVAGDAGILFMLAQAKTGGNCVVMFQALEPAVISDAALEWQLNNVIVNVDDAFGFCYSEGSRLYYQLTFPSADKTWLYDTQTGTWIERRSGMTGRHKANGHLYYRGKHFIFGDKDGDIYYMDYDTYTDHEAVIPRIRRTPYIHKDRLNIFMHSLEVEFASGVGLLSGQGSDPQAMLRTSVDGGRTWGNERWAGIGKRGEYRRRARWSRLGQGRQFAFELTVTDPVPVTILSAHAQMEVGTN